MKHLYFLSDAHLSMKVDKREETKRRKLMDFLDFIESDEDAGALYLLGDIFDFWFQWRHVIPQYWFPILHRLRQLVDAGVRVHFITGNHDFYPGSYLEKEIGIRCFDESHQFEIDGRRFFVAHGDGLAKTDRGYRLMKRIIRNKVSIFLFKTFIHPDLGMAIARWTSDSSRKMVKIEKHSWSEEYHQFARKKFEEGFDYVVLGHIHFPLEKQEKDGKTYVNCGDWMNYFTYARYDGHQLTLNYWENQPAGI